MKTNSLDMLIKVRDCPACHSASIITWIRGRQNKNTPIKNTSLSKLLSRVQQSGVGFVVGCKKPKHNPANYIATEG